MHRLLFAALMAVAIPLQAQTICGPNGCYTPSPRSPRVQVTVRGSRDYSRYASFCKVWVPCPNGTYDRGTGCYARSPQSGEKVVLTAYHLFAENPNARAIVEFPSINKSYYGRVLIKDEAGDVCSIKLEKTPAVCPCVVSTVDVNVGDRLSLAGFGGTPRRGFLAWIGKAVGRVAYGWRPESSVAIEVTYPASQGDSGGPVWNTSGQLVGIITRSGQNKTVITVGLRGQRCRILHKLFPPYRRNPRADIAIQPPPNPQYVAPVPDPIQKGNDDGGSGTPEPSDVTDPGDTTDGDATVPDDDTSSIDYDVIIDAVYEKMIANADKFKGPPGEPGPQGEMGPPGQDGNDAEITPEHLAAIVATLTDQLKNDPVFVAKTTGPQGEPGLPGSSGPPGEDAEFDVDELAQKVALILNGDSEESGWSHIVVVAPKGAEYWNRLDSDIQRARDYWHRLRWVPPPDNIDIGPLPVMVAYSNGIPVRNWAGLRGVEDALSRITRGEFDHEIKTTGGGS
jgi:hypothetical protein